MHIGLVEFAFARTMRLLDKSSGASRIKARSPVRETARLRFAHSERPRRIKPSSNKLHSGATSNEVLRTGMVDHKGILYPGEHDRIIDQATWERVHETLRRNGGDKGATVRNKLGALLRGVLFCVPCGTPMVHTYTMRKSKRHRPYVCYQAQQQGWQESRRHASEG